MDRAEFVRRLNEDDFPNKDAPLLAIIIRNLIKAFDEGYLAGLDKGEELFHRAMLPESPEENPHA